MCYHVCECNVHLDPAELHANASMLQSLIQLSLSTVELISEVKTLEHPTKGRPKKAKKHPPTSILSQKPAEGGPNAADDKPKPYHIKFIPSKIPGNITTTSEI